MRRLTQQAAMKGAQMGDDQETLSARLQLLAAVDADPEELDREMMTLRRDLEELELDVESAGGGSGLPEGSKGGGLDTNAILLALLASGGVLTQLIGLLQNWLSRHERRRIILEISGDRLEIHGASSDAQQLTIREWIERHATEAGS